MRDKVKRFISILMTALMLVNLMPVGALADGITSIGYKPEVAASTGNYTVYVYARFDGDPLPGVTLNASQWYTIGYIANVNLPSPGGTSWGQYWYYNNNNYCGSTINSTSASGIIGGLVQEYHTSIVIKSDEWISANFKACPGADTYKPHTSEPTWHLDIIVDINKNPPVHNLVFKVNNSNGKQIGTPKKVTGKWANPLSANKYYAGNHVPETIIDGGRIYQLKTKREGNPNLDTKIYFDEPIKNVEFYYKDMGPVVRNYTVNYYLKETTTKVAESITGTAPLGETVTPPTEVTGYTLVPGQETSLTIGDDENVLNLYYTPRTDLSYTVNYYWNGTTTKVADSKTITGQMFGEEVTESPIGADGYTPVSTGPKTITIGTGTNEINFYYYKNVTLTANSDTKTYDGQEQMVEPGYICSEKNVTFDNIAEPSGKGTDAGEYPVTFAKGTVGKVDTSKKYIVTVANPGTLTIRKRSVVLTSETASKEYDGTALEKPVVTVTGDGFVAGEVSDVKATGSVTYVSEGEVTNTITYTEGENFKASNYDIQKAEGKLSITAAADKVTVTITGNKVTEKYDGTEKTAKDYTVSIDNDLYTATDFEFKGNAEVKGTDAGTYDMGLNKSQFKNKNSNFSDSNVEFVVNDGQLVINPRPVTLTSEGGSKPYDGTPLTKPVVAVTGDGFVAGEVSDVKATGSVTYVSEGEVTNTITYTEGENFKASNYDIQKAEGKLSITAAADKVTVTITGNKVTEKYDGTEKTAKDYTVSIDNDLYTATDFEFKGNAEVKGTDAGTYDMGLNKSQFKNKNNNFSDSNVEFVVNDGKLEIEKRVVTLTSEGGSKPYDGTALTKPEVAVGGDGFVAGEVTDIKATGSVKDVSEGEVTNAITFTKGEKFNEDNYAIEKNEGKLSITPRKVTLTSATLIKDFDGTPLKNGDTPVKEEFGTEKAFPEGEGVTYTFTGGQTNAGSSKNMFTYAWNEGTKADNYTICPIEGDLVVTPIDGIKVTITGRKDTQTYDGKPHKVEGYDVKPDNPLFTEKDIKFNGEAEATGTDVRIDPYQMGLKPEQFTNTSNNFTNVEFVVEDGQIVITPRPVTLTSETASKTYDGTPLTRPNVTVSTGENDGFVEGEVTDIKATGSVTNAGSVANTITFTPNKETFKEGNYAITKTEGTLTIAKRSVLITSQSATKTYDGSALTRPAVTITGDGFVPGELAKAEATGSITNVGSTPNAIQYTTTGAFNAANYSIALSVGTLTVTEKPKPEPRRTFNLTISYVYQNGKRAAASYNRGGLKNGETFDITSPVIAGYTASETVVSGTIYNRDIKVTVIYTADGVNLDDYGVPLGLGNITMNVGDCFE